jgi:hypothetical protein
MLRAPGSQLLYLDDEDFTAVPLVDRKVRLASLLQGVPAGLWYSDYQIGHGSSGDKESSVL